MKDMPSGRMMCMQDEIGAEYIIDRAVDEIRILEEAEEERR